eukprot:5407596-Prymnesium_polylepis.1
MSAPSTGRTERYWPISLPTISVTTWMTASRPAGVITSDSRHTPQQPSLASCASPDPRTHVAMPSAGGVCDAGKPQRNHAPARKQALYSGAYASTLRARDGPRSRHGRPGGGSAARWRRGAAAAQRAAAASRRRPEWRPEAHWQP